MTKSNIRLLTRLGLVPSLVVAMIVGALASPSQAQKVRPEFFGMHDSQIVGGSVPKVQLGAIRLWDSGTAWRQIETTPGAFNWSGVDAAVRTARTAGIRPMLVLGQTPPFHAAKPTAPGAYGPGASSMPQLSAWTRYVTAAAKRYGTAIDYQIWNEPNVVNYWTGSVAQMVSLTTSASKAITKAIGSKATIVAPSFPLRLSSQQSWYKKYWATKGIAGYVDVVSVAPYPTADEGPEASAALISFARKALPKAARAKPLWSTEINYGLRGGPVAKRISSTKQAAFVARTLLLGAGNRVGRVYWYAWAQGPIANTHLVQGNRRTLTPAGRAWQVTHGWIAGTDMKSCSRVTKGKLKGLYTCTARKSGTEVRRFYWKPSGAAVKITTPRTTKSWTSLSGRTKARKGSFHIKIGSSPLLVTSRR